MDSKKMFINFIKKGYSDIIPFVYEDKNKIGPYGPELIWHFST